jgi:hypothetical protein
MSQTYERPPPGEGGPLELPLHSGAGSSLNAPKFDLPQVANPGAARLRRHRLAPIVLVIDGGGCPMSAPPFHPCL